MAEDKSKQDIVRISVRALVEFLLRSGDIDVSGGGLPDTETMQMGSRLHRRLQRAGGPDYHAEVKLSASFPCDDFMIVVEGRADGIIARDPAPEEPGEIPETGTMEEPGEMPETVTMEEPGKIPETVTIDEIKGVLRSLQTITEPVPVHLAQAKCYAYIYASQHDLQRIDVRMTYASLEDEQVKRFTQTFERNDLEAWFTALLEEYKKWARLMRAWKNKRQASIQETVFPFPYREGQYDLAASVYRTIYHGKKLFIQAPTGTGKTLAVLFPAIKAMGQGLGDRLFYLTARTIGRTVAEEAFDQLRGAGLACKTVTLTAKEKICPCETVDCTPASCPYAKGHYDRINDALYALVTQQDRFTRSTVEQAAQDYMVCPFELSLDLTLFADAVIGDYNYVFHPRSRLKRFFGEGVKGDYLFLIDEAHNLVDRGRSMYSAALFREDFLKLSRVLKEQYPGCANAKKAKSLQGEDGQAAGAVMRALKKCNTALLALEKECETYRVLEDTGALPALLLTLSGKMEDFLECSKNRTASDAVRELYFEVSTFLGISDRLDEHYLIYDENQNGRYFIKLLCVDPSANIEECLGKARSSILFSATLLPVDYYQSLLTDGNNNYAVYASSCFDSKKLQVLIGADTSSRYTQRGEAQYRRMARYIRILAETRKGNYMVFFPSYRMLEDVRYALEQEMRVSAGTAADEAKENDPQSERPSAYDLGSFEILAQESGMREEMREAFLQEFDKEREKSLVGLCVMGGIFAEGIDLKEDRLIGAAIVGTGLPQVCAEQEMLKRYYDQRGMDGFRYAYLCPGMNRVLQAAGRVIRTQEDCGVVLLLDDRFLQTQYATMFPREWEGIETCSLESAQAQLACFWEKQVSNIVHV